MNIRLLPVTISAVGLACFLLLGAAGGVSAQGAADVATEVRSWSALSEFTGEQAANLDRSNLPGLENFTPTPVPEPDFVWLGSIGLVLLALRFRLGRDVS